MTSKIDHMVANKIFGRQGNERIEVLVVSLYAKLDFHSCDGTDYPLLSYISKSTRAEEVDHALKKHNLVLREIQIHLRQL